MKKLYITLVALLFAANFSFAQSTTLKITDLNARYFTYTDPATKTPDTNKVVIVLSCNTANIEQAAKFHVLLGTAAGLGDGLTTFAAVLQQNGSYVISHAGNTFPVHAYKTILQLVLNKTQLANCRYVTIYLEDTNGSNTPALNTMLY
mgnify:CR=1 FL=1